MRAASLKLSLDKSQGQAWIIPYAGVATYQTGYRGVYELAQRTGNYRTINVFKVYEGETLTEDRRTGLHDVTGSKTSDKIIAFCLYFKLVSGFEKTFAMTVEEIERHAAHYAPGNYSNPKSAWNKDHGAEREKMMKKTVLSNGLRQWGVFNPGDRETLDAIESEQGWHVDIGDLPNEDEITVTKAEPKSNEQLMTELGIDQDPPKASAVHNPIIKPEENKVDPEDYRDDDGEWEPEEGEIQPQTKAEPESEPVEIPEHVQEAMAQKFGKYILGECETDLLKKWRDDSKMAETLRLKCRVIVDWRGMQELAKQQ
jgi:recombination protein RecT